VSAQAERSVVRGGKKRFDVSAICAPRLVKWSWGCRQIGQADWTQRYALLPEGGQPRVGDVALVNVEELGYHSHLDTDEARRVRLYAGDRMLAVFGNRYATEVYEGRVLEPENKRVHLLSRSGVIGTVVSRNRNVAEPTSLSLLGYLADSSGNRINVRDLPERPKPASNTGIDVVVVLGTGMSTGKTTVMRRVLHELVQRGLRAAGCKLTGTTSPRDLQEMRATGAAVATDFSDYGFPSTYGATLPELIQLFDCMMETCGRAQSAIVLMEIADGILQRETQMLLEDNEFRKRVRGVVVAAPCSASALYAADRVEKQGLDVWAVSGIITNSPLFMQEFSTRSSVPVVSSRTGKPLADLLLDRFNVREPGKQLREANGG
jgi:hypothetical protein